MTRPWSEFFAGFCLPDSQEVLKLRIRTNLLYFKDNYFLLFWVGLFVMEVFFSWGVGCFLFLVVHPIFRQRHLLSKGNLLLSELKASSDTPPSSRSSSQPSCNVSLILPRHRWVPDSQSRVCMNSSCAREFGFARRRHHCR